MWEGRLGGAAWPWRLPDSWPHPASGYHGGGYSPDGVEPVSPVSSPSLTHDKGLPKHLEELDKSHLEGDLRHKQPGRVPPCLRAPSRPPACETGAVVTPSRRWGN